MKTIALSTALVALALPIFAERPVERTVAAAPDVVLEIDNLSGRVRLHGWDRPEVRVTGTLGDDVEELELTGEGQRIDLDVRLPHGSHGRLDTDAHLEIWYPAAGTVRVEGVSSDFEVDGAAGTIELQTVSGNIEIGPGARVVEAASVSGDLDVNGGGRVEASTVSGSVRLRGVSGELRASSVSGNVEVRATRVRRAELETVSGTIDFDSSLAANARLDLSNHSGNVTLTLPADVSADFDISVFSGTISNDFGPSSSDSRRHGRGSDLSFSTGSGGATISIECFSGRVALRRRS